MNSSWLFRPIALSILMAIALWLYPSTALATSLSPQADLAALPGLSKLFAGQRPSNLGVQSGHLAPCPSSPNCVSSQAALDDTQHAIAPLSYDGDGIEAMSTLREVVQTMDHARLVTATDTYLDFEFASQLMGFVDDVEFYLDPDNAVIQVRSAARLGQSDLDVNRNRIEKIRSLLAA